jgi:Stage II sporulation protein E (SpoIIE)
MPGYIHLELSTRQSSKLPGHPCGDLVGSRRSETGTLIVLGDGIGSSVRASIAAEICVSRLMELTRLGFSPRRAVELVAESMDQFRSPEKPYAAFNVAWIRTDGLATIFSFEAPPPIFVGHGHAKAFNWRNLNLPKTTVFESGGYIRPGQALILMSDGITQSGLGTCFSYGWTAEGVVRFANDCIAEGKPINQLPELIHQKAREYWQTGGDDCSIVMARCRRSRSVPLLTGPPENHADDGRLVRRFMRKSGTKIVCGGSTSEMVARELKQPIEIESELGSLVCPPGYKIEGIDLATEGAVTLNQVYRILDCNPEEFPDDAPVYRLCRLLQHADRIEIFLGDAINPGENNISFRQKGVL